MVGLVELGFGEVIKHRPSYHGLLPDLYHGDQGLHLPDEVIELLMGD